MGPEVSAGTVRTAAHSRQPARGHWVPPRPAAGLRPSIPCVAHAPSTSFLRPLAPPRPERAASAALSPACLPRWRHVLRGFQHLGGPTDTAAWPRLSPGGRLLTAGPLRKKAASCPLACDQRRPGLPLFRGIEPVSVHTCSHSLPRGAWGV